jgi:hypothetical protein
MEVDCGCARNAGSGTARRSARYWPAERANEPDGEDDPQEQIRPQHPHLGQILRGSRQKPGRKKSRACWNAASRPPVTLVAQACIFVPVPIGGGGGHHRRH